MKPRQIFSSLMAVLILSMFVATNLVATAANATNYSTTEASDFERNNELDIWIGDILRIVHDPIQVWSEPDLTGHQLDLEPHESMTVSKIIGDVYAVKIPKVHSLYYTKFDPEQVELSYRSASRLVDAKRITFYLDFAERYEIFSSMDESSEVVGIIHKNQVIENFKVCSYEDGWIYIGENQYVNLGSYSGFMFEYDEDITTTSTTTTATTTTTTVMTTTTTNVTEEPEITTTVTKTQYELNDIVVVKEPVEVYSLDNELIEGSFLNEYQGFKVLGIEHSWYTVAVWNAEETLKVKITEENYEKFSLVYRENTSATTTTTVPTTTSNTSTTTSSTTTSVTTTSETTTSSVTTTNVTTTDIPVFGANSVLKFIGSSWGERAQTSLEGDPIAYFTPDNPYVILGEYCDNGWYNVAGNGTYINILEKDEYLFEDITCSYEPNTKILFLGEEWNVRETAAWGQNLTGDTYPWLTVATVLKTNGNWHYIVDECDVAGWIFVDPNIWVEYDSVIDEEEYPTEPPVENPTDEPVELPEETLFQAGDTVMVKSWDDWALRSAQDWSADVVKLRVPRGNTITVIKALSERWFLIEYQENLYYMNIPEGQEEWFEKVD